MKRFQFLCIAVGTLVLALVLAQPVKATIATQQDQIVITIVVNVTPSPLAYNPQQTPAQADAKPVISGMSLERVAPAAQREFRAEGLHFAGDSSTLVAQAQVQHGALVQSEVTPNPKATLLYSNVTSVEINAIAGTTVQVPCAFTVTVDMNSTWSLEEGITNDFAAGFPGTDLANNTFVNSATPKPTATPYVVYADDGSSWSVLGTGAVMTTYCVTLTLTVPSATSAGAYSTNAIYTLFN
jgi:hypothetical protein